MHVLELHFQVDVGVDVPLVSVIVPTSHSGETLDRCIASIRGQTVSDVEVLVVDNNSGDDTPDIVDEYEDVQFLRRSAGRADARAIGARNASGDYLLHIDSDMELTPSVVEECLRKGEAEYDAAIIPERSVGDSYWANCLDVEKRLFRETGRGYLRFIDADLYDSIGGHTSGLVAGEDEDLHRRAVSEGARVAVIDAEIRHLEGDVGFVEIIRRKLFYARHHPESVSAEAALDDRAERNLVFLKTLPRILLDDPVHTVGYVPIAVVALTAQLVQRTSLAADSPLRP